MHKRPNVTWPACPSSCAQARLNPLGKKLGPVLGFIVCAWYYGLTKQGKPSRAPLSASLEQMSHMGVV
jgi:hypothetical protein